MTINKEIKDAIKEGKLLIGSEKIFKEVKQGSVNTVIHASNCPETSKRDLNYYSKHFGIELKRFNGSSVELGELCGKPFNILLVGIKK